MGNPANLNNLFSQSANSTTRHPSFVWDTSSFNHRPEQTAVDADVFLNSGYLANSLAQNQGIPMSGQLGLGQNFAQGRISRNNLILGTAIHDHRTANPQPLPKEVVNLNIFIGNNSTTNINFLTNSIPQFTSLPIAEQAQPRNTIFWAAPSSQRIPNAIPYLRQQQYGSSHQQQPQGQLPSTDLTNRAISQNNLNLAISSLRPRTMSNYHLPTFPGSSSSSNNSQVDFAGGNGTLRVGRLHSEPNLLALPATEYVRNQVSDPSVKHPSLSNTHNEPLSPTPTQNAIVIGPQQEARPNYPNRKIDLNTPAKGCKQSAVKHKSDPYIKYGPYTCPTCRVIFNNRHCFAAHFQKHYRDEFSLEQERRLESKTQNKDESIMKTTAGVTIAPKSPCSEDKLLVKSDTNNAQVINVNEGEGVGPSGKIEQEVVTEYKN